MEIVLNYRLLIQTSTPIKISDVNLKNKVEELRNEAAGKTNLQKDTFELIYCGCILEDDTTLESCGLKNGAMIHVLRKKIPEEPAHVKPFSDNNITQLASAFRSFNENPALRSALHRLSKRPEVIENIISSSPGLGQDTVAIAMLQDPDLMAHFTDPATVKRIAELHPLLVEAAQHISTAVHEEAHNAATNTDPSNSTASTTAYSYSLDNLSDDEEMAGDSSQSSDSTQPSLLNRYPSNSAVTTAQLAAALSRTGARGFPYSGGTLSSSSSSSRASRNSGVITTEMFSQAMQQAFAFNPSSNVSTPSTPTSPPQSVDIQRQLAQMHEIGLLDDSVNLQALQITNGDVQAAIELVFSGFSDN
ncbi:ubiquitin-like protein 7 [Leptopilina boulardi]|uniref:ubiquitin-like protein 7 n=1 Tax=Leptopilina boulardi TaxID=63433 RepID=UPI0021F5F692|nr:ubiquitin-like protein 7 [Leptopilina boulardi]